MTHDHAEAGKTALDLLSYTIALGVLVELLPTIAAGLSIIWLLIQISQSRRFSQMVTALRWTWRWLTRRRT